MNRDEHFEDRLAHVPQRPVPAAWREEILTAARAAAPRPVSAQTAGARGSVLSISRPQPPKYIRTDPTRGRVLIAMLWPHPRAWAGLAAAWVLILVLTVAGRDPRDLAQTEMARQARPPSPELRELLRQQERLFAELTGRSDGVRPAAVRPPAAEPRSQRREDSFNA